MKRIQPLWNRCLRVNLRRLAAVFPALIGLLVCELPPPYCEPLLLIQLFNLRCPAASRGARIKPRAQQLPVFLSGCQEIANLEKCHVLLLLKVRISFESCQKK